MATRILVTDATGLTRSHVRNRLSYGGAFAPGAGQGRRDAPSCVARIVVLAVDDLRDPLSLERLIEVSGPEDIFLT